MNEYLKRAQSYFSPETIDCLVKDDLTYHYKHLLLDIVKYEKENVMKKTNGDFTDYHNNIAFASAFSFLLEKYYAVNVNAIKNEVYMKLSGENNYEND